MFVGRKTELGKLNEMYASGKYECAIVYGRRRVGKTTLIKEFIKDKRAIYFLAREADGMVNLSGFGKDVYGAGAAKNNGATFFADWDKAFDYIYEESKNERLVLAIDEYPYLAGGFRPISSILQAHIDNRFKESKLFLILCGSSMSFMENQVLGYQSPLYGRKTAQFKISAFSFYESTDFLDSFGMEDKAILYGISGGIPEYLGKIDSKKSVKKNVLDLFLTPSGHFYEEPSNLLKQELREPAVYNGIIEAIAQGASKLNEISTKCRIENKTCAKNLNALISLGIIKKETPITERLSKKSIYLLNDMMFRFWYRFVFPNMSGITNGLGENVYEQEVHENINAYMGLVFEEICKEYLIMEAKGNNLPFPVINIGRWWGTNPAKKRQEEIDILAIQNDNALFAECKWTNALVDIDILQGLKEKSELFTHKKKWFWLFVKKGFTPRLVEVAKNNDNIRLVAYNEMTPKNG